VVQVVAETQGGDRAQYVPRCVSLCKWDGTNKTASLVQDGRKAKGVLNGFGRNAMTGSCSYQSIKEREEAVVMTRRKD